MSDDALKFIVRFFRPVVAILVVCVIEGVTSLFVFGSNRFLGYFGLVSVAEKLRGFFSAIFLGASILIILWVLDLFNRQILDKWEEKNRIKGYIRKATLDETLVLLKIAESGNNSVPFHPLNPDVRSLVDGRATAHLVSGS